MSGVRDYTEDLLKEMEENGVLPHDNLMNFSFDGEVHRFATIDKPHHQNGWYVIYPNSETGIPAGAYGDWGLSDDPFNWRAKESAERDFSQADLQHMRKQQEEAREKARKQKEKQAAAAAVEAQNIWENAQKSTEKHEYLQKKHIKPNTARIDNKGNLIVPLYDSNGQITSLRYISRDGKSKWFQKNGSVKGCYGILGDLKDQGRVYIAEGFSTAASIYEATGTATIISFGKGNILPVSVALKDKHPQLEQIFIADNDENEAGIKAARAAAEATGARVIPIPEPGMDANDYAQAGKDLKALLEAEEIKQDQELIDNLKIFRGSDLSEEFEPPDELVQDLLCLDSLAVLYGNSNSGKTFFAVELARAVSEGVAFFGRRVDRGIALYIAAESPASIRNRQQALKKYHGSTLDYFYRLEAPVNFHAHPEQVERIIRAMKIIEKREKKKIHLIVVDTLSRIAAGANENSGEDMGAMMECFDRLKNASKAAVMIIHHSGKDATKGARGWSGIRGAVDTEIEVKELNADVNGETVRVAEFTKQRELPSKGTKILYDLQVVEMGKGKFGNTVSTCVVIPTEKIAKSPRNNKIQQKIDDLCNAWKSGSRQRFEGQPLVTTEELTEYMSKEVNTKTNKPVTEAAIKQRLKLSDSTSWAAKLKDEGIIKSHKKGKGFIILGEIGEDLINDENLEYSVDNLSR